MSPQAVDESPPAMIRARLTVADAVAAIVLVVATVAAYWGVGALSFVGYDDPQYVTENPIVQRGLTAEGAWWALTSGHASNWHPLTWLSHMLDCELFGVEPRAHHLHNLALHALNGVLLFLLFRTLGTGTLAGALAAALFALHPLHVESVAWVAERKDLLSTWFALLALLGYVRYARTGAAVDYFAVAVLFGLALLAKPMVVTLPFVMLLLDYWPLGRMRSGAGAAGERQSLRELLMEKGPLLAMSGFVCLMTLWAQREGGAVKALEEFPLHLRAANAALAYAKYLWMTVWPSPLAVFYPMPRPFPYLIACAAAAGVVVVTVLALRLARRWPYLIVGWFCFLGTLVPVIGLVQVGQQAMADRYTYLPHVGLFMIVAFALRDVMRGRAVTAIATTAVVAACVALGALTWRQVPVWRNSVTLYSHAIAVTSDNYLAENNLGAALAKRGDVPAALPHFIRALRIRPTYESAEKNLRRALQVLSEDPRVERDELAEARQALEEAMRRRQEQE